MKAAFLDRDATLIEDLIYLRDPERLRFLPGAIEGLQRFQDAGYLLFVVTNQSGVVRGFLSLDRMKRIHRRMLAELNGHGIRIHGVHYCPHGVYEGCGCRKPGTYMIKRILDEYPEIELGESVVIGDRESDVLLGKNVDARTVLITKAGGPFSSCPDVTAETLLEAAGQVLKG
jgi:histidinol-phosphate phosphatase family protein